MDSKGFSLFEVVLASLIGVILAVPALQGFAGAYRAYNTIQAEYELISDCQLVISFYQDLYHGEAKTIDSTASDQSGNASSAFYMPDANAVFTLTRNYVGPPIDAVPAYFVVAPATRYDQYLLSLTVESSIYSKTMPLAFLVSAYYQTQIP